MGRTTEGCSRQATWAASAVRSGGGMAFWMEGRLMTRTDLGLWKLGGVLSRRLSWASCGKAIAGMY